MERHIRDIVFNRGTTLPQRFSVFLNTDNANNILNGHLTLEKKICFLRDGYGDETETDHNGTLYDYDTFSEAEFETYKNEFKRLNEEYWSNKFWLIPSDAYEDFDVTVSARVYRPNLKFDLRILLVNTREEAHSTFIVHNGWRVVDGRRHQIQAFAPPLSQSGVARDGQIFTYSNSPTESNVWEQIASIHEFGHVIGEDHIGVHSQTSGCDPAYPNQPICYQSPSGDTANIMGEGMQVESWNAEPWIFGLERILGGQIRRWRLEVNRLGDANFRFPAPRLIGDASILSQILDF